MKSLKSFFAFLGIIMLTACSQFDDSAIMQQLKDHEARILELERQYKELQQNINSLASALSALDKQDHIKSVTPVVYGGETIGYTITFMNSDPITIYHGKNGENGKDGKDGTAPVISIKQDSDGIWYWTFNGTWLLDESGNKIKAIGVDGKDGVTPQVKIVDEYWYISTDNGVTWTKLEKATGENGKDGQDGDSFFKSVVETDTAVILTLSDGTEISLPKYVPLNITFEYEKGAPIIGEIRIPYVITGRSQNYEVEAISSHYTWDASIEKTDANNGFIVINANGSYYQSKIIVFVTAENGETTTRVLSFESGVFMGSVSYYELSSEAHTLSFNIKTNLQYQISIPDEAESWIQVSSGTKAIREESISIDIAANNSGSHRSATISFISQERNVYSIDILQYAGTIKIKLVMDAGSSTKSLVVGPDGGYQYDFEDNSYALVNGVEHKIYKENGDSYIDVEPSDNGYYIIYPSEMCKGYAEPKDAEPAHVYLNYPVTYPPIAKIPFCGYAVPHEITPTANMSCLSGILKCQVKTEESISLIKMTNATPICSLFDTTLEPYTGKLLYSSQLGTDYPEAHSISIPLSSGKSEFCIPIPIGTLENCEFALFNGSDVIVDVRTNKGHPMNINAGHITAISLAHNSESHVSTPTLLSYVGNKARVRGQVMAVGKTGFIINDGSEENIQIYTSSSPTVSKGNTVQIDGLISSYAGVLEISDPSISASSSISPTIVPAKTINKDNIGSFSDKYSTLISAEGIFTSDQYYTVQIEGSSCDIDINTTQNLSSYNNKKVRITGYSIGKTSALLHVILSSIEIIE